MTHASDLPEKPALGRRAALAKLGLAAATVYMAPSLLALADARASSRPSHPRRRHRRHHRRHVRRHVRLWHRHPRRAYWVGRRFPYERRYYVVIRDYHHYHLPPPPRGHFYARVDDEVFLVAEATKRIIDAFVLLDAAAS